MNWRDWLYFSKGERQGLIVVLCLVTVACILMIRNQKTDTASSPSSQTDTAAQTGAVSQTDTASQAGTSSQSGTSAQTLGAQASVSSSSKPSSRLNTSQLPTSDHSENAKFSSDKSASTAANDADSVSAELMNNRMVTESVGERKESVSERVQRLTSYGRPSYPRTEKFAEGTVVELNGADTTVLKKVPGIGSAFAKRIVGYRALLGGYYSVTQLSEVYGIDEDKYNALAPWFTADPSLVVPLSVNNLPQDSLRRHPYINYGQAKIITQLRRQKGKLTGWENLRLLDEFTDGDRIRLTPYLSFE